MCGYICMCTCVITCKYFDTSGYSVCADAYICLGRIVTVSSMKISPLSFALGFLSCLVLTTLFYLNSCMHNSSSDSSYALLLGAKKYGINHYNTTYVNHTIVTVTPVVTTDTHKDTSRIHVASLPTLHTVTYATHGGSDDRFCRAVESSIRSEYNLVILGWGLKWLGLSQKLIAAYEYAKALPPTDVILFTDAFDVLFVDTPTTVLQNFMQMNASIVFSGECGCWPHIMEDVNVCLHKYPKAPTPYRYLNSGTWIGYADEASKMLSQVISDAGNNFINANDQKLVADMYIAGTYDIKLDFYCNIFQSMHMTLAKPLPYCNPSKDVKMVGGRWYNNAVSSYPAIIHFNGNHMIHTIYSSIAD